MDKGPALLGAHTSIQIDSLAEAIMVIPDVPAFFVNALCRPSRSLAPGCTMFSPFSPGGACVALVSGCLNQQKGVR